MFWVPTLGRAFVVWCIRMVHLYGGGAVGVLGPDHREGIYGLVYTYGVYAWGGGVIGCSQPPP